MIFFFMKMGWVRVIVFVYILCVLVCSVFIKFCFILFSVFLIFGMRGVSGCSICVSLGLEVVSCWKVFCMEFWVVVFI